MKKLVLPVFVLLLAGATAFTALQHSRMKHPHTGQEITVAGKDGDGSLLASGWRITPAGRQIPSGDMILSAQVSPDGKLLAFTNTGYAKHALHLVDMASEREVANFPLDRSWSGLAWSPDSKRIYLSAGVSGLNEDILAFQRWDSGWTQRGGFALKDAEKTKTAVSSLAVSADGKVLYALNNGDYHLYILETQSGRALARIPVGDHPLSAKLSADGNTLFVANLGSSEVAAVDVSDPVNAVVAYTLPVDAHPNDLALTSDGRLFVSCGNTNNVVSLDLKTKSRLETINVALTPRAPAGSTPNSLVVSPDGRQLYVVNADNNNVAVVSIEDRANSKILGFIPTGWYPTVATVSPDGKRLLVGTGKGMGTGANRVDRPVDQEDPQVGFLHHGNNLAGFMAFIDTPNSEKLAQYTKQVYANTPYRDTMLETAETNVRSVIPSKVGAGSPVKHILYIIKENRTYDQVFGDMPQGNGDPSLTLFGKDVTPNQHAIAEQFVLLDNLYCSGEVSQDGHPWSISAYATEFTQRAWTLGYSRHGSVNLSNGMNELTLPNLPDGIWEQKSPYIWEAAANKGLRVEAFSYGGLRSTAGIQSKMFERRKRKASGEPVRTRDYDRADNFVEEFRMMERENRMPNFMIMSLGEDHTSGTLPGAFTPKAQVASNDLAVGKIVEAISKSTLWSQFAIFIIEDDAQNGPDHIDSHRTVGMVISPYIKRKTVDSTMYSTVSMLRTMELLLGLPPMTQHDAAAPPMFASFSDKADLSGFSAVGPRTDLHTKNLPNAYGADLSAKMDWDEYDQADEKVLNAILWHSIKGTDVPMPAPVRRAVPIAVLARANR